MILRNSAQRSNVSDKLKSAKALMNLGFKIVPLRPGEKVPTTPHGVKDATNDLVTFKRLIPASGNYNIGVATGSASNVIIFDVDQRNGGIREFANLIQRFGPLPNTMISETGGGGRHYFLRPPHGGIKKKVLAPGVDLLAEGSYAVAPPSRHPSGKSYKWLNGRGPESQKIASLPDSWVRFIDADNQARNDSLSRGASKSVTFSASSCSSTMTFARAPSCPTALSRRSARRRSRPASTNLSIPSTS
jgi:hypothetical protein